MSPSFDSTGSYGLNFPYVLNNRWEVVDRLGQGGMGTVYMARDLNLQTLGHQKKACVVKELRDDFFREEDKEKAQEFFLREQNVLASLDHPNIVRVLDQFSQKGKFYLVMEYVQGQNLHEMVMKRGEPFPEETVIGWAVQICDVLEYLHEHDPPVIYRDLKPSNVMIDSRDQVKLVDFGIARPFEETEDNTHVVSQGYSPPEQYWGGADRRSDIYALGATLHFLLTGEDPLALMVASPKSINPNVSDRLDSIVQQATQQALAARYPSAAELREDLLEQPVEDKFSKTRTIQLVLTTVALVGVFFGLLMWGAHIHDEIEKQNKSVQTYEKQTEITKEKEKLLEEQMQKLKKLKSLFIKEQLDGSKSSTDADESPSAQSESLSNYALPMFEERNEAALTDPAAIDSK